MGPGRVRTRRAGVGAGRQRQGPSGADRRDCVGEPQANSSSGCGSGGSVWCGVVVVARSWCGCHRLGSLAGTNSRTNTLALYPAWHGTAHSWMSSRITTLAVHLCTRQPAGQPLAEGRRVVPPVRVRRASPYQSNAQALKAMGTRHQEPPYHRRTTAPSVRRLPMKAHAAHAPMCPGRHRRVSSATTRHPEQKSLRRIAAAGCLRAARELGARVLTHETLARAIAAPARRLA